MAYQQMQNVYLIPMAVPGHKVGFLRIVTGMVAFYFELAKVFNFQACWCDILNRILFFKKE